MSQLLSMGSCPYCKNGKNTPCFATYSNGYYCFTCGVKKYTTDNYRAYKGFNNQYSKLEIGKHTRNIAEFSPETLKWLYKYYIFDNLIRKYGICYIFPDELHEEALLFGVYKENELKFWQKRYFPSKRFVTKGDKNTLFTRIDKTQNTIILVEDFISAIRIAEITNVLCLFGVHINDHMSKYLFNLNMNILVWLDPDEAGQTASIELCRKLNNYMQIRSKYRAFAIRELRTVEVMTTDKQPKDYCNEELKHIIEENTCKL